MPFANRKSLSKKTTVHVQVLLVGRMALARPSEFCVISEATDVNSRIQCEAADSFIMISLNRTLYKQPYRRQTIPGGA